MNIKSLFDEPIISIILILGLLFLINIPGGYIEEYFSIPSIIIDIIIALIILLLYSYYFHFDSFFKLDNFKLGLILLIPLFIYFIINLIVDHSLSFTNFSDITLFLSVVGAGVIEEVFFRGILISNCMRILKGKYKIYITTILSAGIFALIHFLNYNGNNLGSVTVQVITSFSFVLLAAIFIRTGNIWVPIIGHVLNNFISFLYPANFTATGEMLCVVDWTCYVDIVLSIILVIIGLYYIRSAKHKEITELWDKKWSKE